MHNSFERDIKALLIKIEGEISRIDEEERDIDSYISLKVSEIVNRLSQKSEYSNLDFSMIVNNEARLLKTNRLSALRTARDRLVQLRNEIGAAIWALNKDSNEHEGAKEPTAITV